MIDMTLLVVLEIVTWGLTHLIMQIEGPKYFFLRQNDFFPTGRVVNNLSGVTEMIF